MPRTFRSRLLLYFLVLSIISIILTSFSVWWGFGGPFSEYLQENRNQHVKLVVQEITEEYEQSGELMNDQVFSLIHQQAMNDQLFYKIYDQNGRLLLNTVNMQGRMGMMGGGQVGTNENNYLSDESSIKVNDTVIGKMVVYYSEEFLEEESHFFDAIKRNIWMAGIVTIILSFLFSLLFSKKLSSGFQQFSQAVSQLKNHQFSTPLPVEVLDDEMKSLGESLNQLAEGLSKEELLRKQFTADFAHEIRTPLATLRSQIEAYQDGIWEPTQERLQQSHDELMRLVRLVNELEKLLAAENPQIKLEMVDMDAVEIIKILEAQFSPLFHEKGVQLVIDKTMLGKRLRGDKDRVIQILTNIVTNALKYTPKGKAVKIGMEEKDNFIGFTVEDEGVGIPNEDLPYIFERFYRGDKSRDRKTGGIGIGLSIVKALVDAQGGKIEMDSQIDKGTIMKVYFQKL